MAKRKPETSEYTPEWDDGTYQTGAIRPPKPSSGLVAFLLVGVIFLGGICSALGLLNIRLLQQLMEKYTFQGVENSWLKLCYYYDHLAPQN